MKSSRPIHRFNQAIVRSPARSVVYGLRTNGGPRPTYQGIKAEHDAYVDALRAAGVEVTVLTALEEYPDSIFVEHPALVFTEGSILLRPGTPSRVEEGPMIGPTLWALFDRVFELPWGAFVDGGDILTSSDTVLIGLSTRTTPTGAAALRLCLDRLDRKSELVATPKGVPHFKSDCSLIDEYTILTTERLAASGVFQGKFREILVPAGEEGAANALRVNDVLLVGRDYPRTIDLLVNRGYPVVTLEVSEIGKIDAGLSCMSLRWFAE